jgi:hypothetical protein
VIGGGGFDTNGNCSLDGRTHAMHSNTGGPYFLRTDDDKGWRKFLRAGDNYHGSTKGMYTDQGAFCRVAESNSDVMMAMVSGVLLRTTDGGATVEDTAFPRVPIELANWQDNSGFGEHFRFDPNNYRRAVMGTKDGLAITDNLFDTYRLVDTSQLPVPSGADHYHHVTIEFDRHHGVDQKGNTAGFYVNVPGHGRYYTADAGIHFAPIPGGPPATFCTMAVDPRNGLLHLGSFDPASGSYFYWRWDGATWISRVTAYGNANQVMQGVRPVIDPHKPGRIFFPSQAGTFPCSLDDGLTWNGAGGPLSDLVINKADRVKWLAFTNQVYHAFGTAYFDPVIVGRTWMHDGVGFWRADNIPDVQSPTTKITWTEQSAGIENLTMGNLFAGRAAFGAMCQDRNFLAMPWEDVCVRFPSSNGPTAVDKAAITPGGQDMDEAPEDPTFLVGTCLAAYNEWGGVSANAGKSWRAITNEPGAGVGGLAAGQASGGNIVVLSKAVWIQAQVNNGKLIYTLDGGETPWRDLTPFFGPNFNQGNNFASYGFSRKILVKDRYNPNTAYFYCIGTDADRQLPPDYDSRTPKPAKTRAQMVAEDEASRGCWKIVFDPAAKTFSCSRQRNRLISGGQGTWGQDYYRGKLVQYGNGHWIWSGGEGAIGLYESKDDMVTWGQVNGSDDQNGNFGGTAGFFVFPYAVAVGPGEAPGDPKTVMVIGHRPPTPDNPVSKNWGHDYYGAWLCRNFDAPDSERAWTRIVQYPGGYVGGFYGNISDCVAHPTQFGFWMIAPLVGGVFRLMREDIRQTSA